MCRNCGGRGHFRDECPSPYYRERGFAVQEERVEQQEGERDIGGDELKYEEGFDENEYTEELAHDFVAMITVKYGDERNHLDVSEVAALAREEHSIHLDSCCTRHMITGRLVFTI